MSELSLIRLIAAAQREREANLELSPLQAIDRVQKLHERFKADWVGSPWLVLPINPAIDPRPFCVPATMPVPEMLEAIKKHGQPCGIVGLALLKDGTARVLKMMFRKDEKCRKAVNQSADAAWQKYQERARQINDLFDMKKGN